jgi:hypothetical protein
MSETLLQVAAVVAGVVLLAGPYIGKAASSAAAWAKSLSLPKPAGGTDIDDMRTVLELASRMRLAGNTEGVKLCQQLLDSMLAPKADA